MTRVIPGVVMVALLLMPGAPARADISGGDLLVSDLFRWPDWREILANFDCDETLVFYLWNAPETPIVIPPAILVDPPPIDIVVPPPILPPPVIPPPTTPVPEPSTWAMLAIGLAALGWLKTRKRMAP